MSEFQVQVVKIDDVIEHPNADKLTIVKIGGYNCIANKKEDGSWRYQKGDLVVYIPEAAVLPEVLLKKMDFWDDSKGKGMLSGNRGDRVKAIKLRGVVSQGILYPIKQVDDSMAAFLVKLKKDCIIERPFPESNINGATLEDGFCLGDDVSDFLQIVKYEPPIPVHMAGQITGGLFGYTKSYDIENAQKYPNAFDEGENIVATEKLHGTLCQIGFLNDAPDTIKHELFEIDTPFETVHGYVTSKGLAKKGIIQKNTPDNESNIYVAVYKKFIADKASDIVERFIRLNKIDASIGTEKPKRWRLYIFGEIVGRGVQDLGYGKQEPEFRVFDVYVKIMNDSGTVEKEGFLSSLNLANWCTAVGLRRVPVLYTGPFTTLADLEQYRDGATVEGDAQHIREGIVIRPTTEREFGGFPNNRLQLKFVSPDYLLRKDGTEYT